MNILNQIVSFMTGEFLLRFYPNGGTVVLLRTLITSSIIYSIFLIIKGLLLTGFGPNFDWSLVRSLVSDTLLIAGAIIAGTYTAFHSRFVSQWAYLAVLYNELMSTQAQAPSDGTGERERVYVNWKAGIIEDAYTLHLAAKPMFAPLVAGLLEDPKVVASFLSSAIDSELALSRLENQLSKTLKKKVKVART